MGRAQNRCILLVHAFGFDGLETARDDYISSSLVVSVSSERSSSSSTTKTWEGHAATACCTFCNRSREGRSRSSSTTPSLSRWVNTPLAARTQAPLAIHRLVKAVTFIALSFLFYTSFPEKLLLCIFFVKERQKSFGVREQHRLPGTGCMPPATVVDRTAVAWGYSSRAPRRGVRLLHSRPRQSGPHRALLPRSSVLHHGRRFRTSGSSHQIDRSRRRASE